MYRKLVSLKRRKEELQRVPRISDTLSITDIWYICKRKKRVYDSRNCNGNQRAGGGGEEGPDRAQSSSGVAIVQMLSQTYHISQLFVGVEWQNGYPT